MKITNKFYTYVHMRNDDGSVFYIGKGSRDRAWKKDGRGTLWTRIVKKHGYTVHLCGIWDLESDALEHEVRLIDQYKIMGCKIINMTLGGDGVSGYRHTNEAKQKASKFMLSDGNKLRGKQLSLEHRKKISESNKGKKFTEEHKLKLSAKKKENESNNERLRKIKIGTKISDAHKEAIRKANTGKVVSELTRERMKAAWVLRKSSCA